MNAEYQKLVAQFPQIEEQKPLSELNTLKVGGAADLYFPLTEIKILPELIEAAADIPYLILGGGSNIIFHDDGFRGLIIHMKANQVKIENNTIIADAGALVSQIIQIARKNNLSGLENLTGLPGTIGGAVRGNAGAYGTEIKDLLQEATIYNQDKGLHKVNSSYFDFAYRTSKVKTNKDIILKIHLKLKKSTPEIIQQKTQEVLKSRKGKQPVGKTSGSIFKNPNPDLSAGYLLDQAGCKNLQVGGAKVSDLHANWIINLGNAKQKDIIELVKIMREKVEEKFSITLEPEVQFVSTTGFLYI